MDDRFKTESVIGMGQNMQSNRGQSNGGQSLIRDWIDLDSKRGWKLKNMGMRRRYGLNLVPFIL